MHEGTDETPPSNSSSAVIGARTDALLTDLDPAQRAAVTTPSTLVAVIAAAGSGKTRVLTRRITHRIAIGSADARHTLALTFTREAAGELRRRLRRVGLREPVEAGTFHAVALALLRQRWQDLGQRPPTIVGERERLLAEVAGDIPVAVLAVEADWSSARGVTPDRYVHAARDAQRRGAIRPERIAGTLAAYETVKRRRGVVDLDDLLALATRELASDPTWADGVRWRYRHLLVDEAQDLNPVQHRLLHLLVGDRDDLFVVGDPAQAIYGFNGSDPTLLTDISRHLPGVEIVHLPTNHRCTPQVVAAGAHVLTESGQRADAVSGRSDGPHVEVRATADADDEAGQVAALVRHLDPDLVRLGQVAVLARTNHQLSRLGRALEARRVAVRRRQLTPGSPLANAVRGATALPSASRLRAWAHDVVDGPPDGGLGVLRPPPVRPGGRIDGRRHDDGGRAATASQVVDAIEEAERLVAVAVLGFLREQPLGDGAGLRSWIATTNPFADGPDSNGVELLTFHAAKGREWHTVIATGVETGLVPHRSATTVTGKAEEARLLHVAVTRASDRLVLTWAARRGGYARKPSPWITGLDTTPMKTLPVPEALRRQDPPPDPRADRLHRWRQDAARAASVLPESLCTDHEMTEILTADPLSVEELVEATGFGRITAGRLFPAIRQALDGATPPAAAVF